MLNKLSLDNLPVLEVFLPHSSLPQKTGGHNEGESFFIIFYAPASIDLERKDFVQSFCLSTKTFSLAISFDW